MHLFSFSVFEEYFRKAYGKVDVLTLIRMTKDEKDLAVFKGLMLLCLMIFLKIDLAAGVYLSEAHPLLGFCLRW
jgi:hypothetical protein